MGDVLAAPNHCVISTTPIPDQLQLQPTQGSLRVVRKVVGAELLERAAGTNQVLQPSLELCERLLRQVVFYLKTRHSSHNTVVCTKTPSRTHCTSLLAAKQRAYLIASFTKTKVRYPGGRGGEVSIGVNSEGYRCQTASISTPTRTRVALCFPVLDLYSRVHPMALRRLLQSRIHRGTHGRPACFRRPAIALAPPTFTG